MYCLVLLRHNHKSHWSCRSQMSHPNTRRRQTIIILLSEQSTCIIWYFWTRGSTLSMVTKSEMIRFRSRAPKSKEFFTRNIYESEVTFLVVIDCVHRVWLALVIPTLKDMQLLLETFTINCDFDLWPKVWISLHKAPLHPI